ncbi:MAG: acyl-CoA synthetase [Alphaproteobacteria bacterium]|nr:acyl-CoA synthetase [Alphaproteobacteria bacterium]
MRPVATYADVLRIEEQGWPTNLPSNTYDAIRQGAAIDPDAPALSFFMSADSIGEAEVWTYRDLLRRITQTANAFHELGLRKDDVIAFVLPNLPETHFTIWGGEATAIVAAFNPLLEARTLATLLAAAKAKALVTLAPFPDSDLWLRLQPELAAVDSLQHIVLVNLADRIQGPVKKWARQAQEHEVAKYCGDGGVQAKLPAHVAVHDFWTIVDRQQDDHLCSDRQIAAEDISSFFCTGGTTGLPKIAMRQHGAEVANAWSVTAFLGDVIGPGKTLFCGLPLFHVNGVLVTGLVPFSKGAHVVLGTPQGYRGVGVVRRFWEIVELFKVNFFSGVPTLYASLMQTPVGAHDISSLEYGLCGAAPMPVEVFRKFQEVTGLQILEGYGLTEATCVSSINPSQGERRIGSIGLRLPGQAMKAVMLDDEGHFSRDCAVDEVGLLAISGPNVFRSYLSVEHNAGLWLDCGDGRRWLNTGDLGRQDADGYFWLTGRKKELIIRGGHNIDPATIEEVFHQHPDVQLAAAIGRPDAYAGELPVAYVQLKQGSHTTEEELAAFARARIGERAAQPKFIRLIDQIPLTTVGKLFKPALKNREIKDAIADALLNAEIEFVEVSVVEAPSQGTSICVVLANAEDETRARVIMGNFSYPFSIRMPNNEL